MQGCLGRVRGSDQPLQSVLRPHLEELVAPRMRHSNKGERVQQRVVGWTGELQHSPREAMLGLRGFPLGKQEGFGGGSGDCQDTARWERMRAKWAPT